MKGILVGINERKKSYKCYILALRKESQNKHIRYEAHLVAHGCKQKTEIDYENTFFPLAKRTIMKLVPSIAIAQGWELHHMDVKLTFLNGKIEEEIYIR
jgi:hypothetical protein